MGLQLSVSIRPHVFLDCGIGQDVLFGFVWFFGWLYDNEKLYGLYDHLNLTFVLSRMFKDNIHAFMYLSLQTLYYQRTSECQVINC